MTNFDTIMVTIAAVTLVIAIVKLAQPKCRRLQLSGNLLAKVTDLCSN